MRRALALTVAATGWVAVIQLVTGSMAPPPEYEVQGLVTEFQAEFFDSTRADKSPTAFATDEPATTTTTTLPVETTTTSAVTTTTASTTTTVPATTTTRPKPAPTTTTAGAPPPTTTTAPAPVCDGSKPVTGSTFVELINSLRASFCKAPLATNSSLANYAQSWSEEMASTGNFGHSNIESLLGPWEIVGENIGRGGSVVSIFNALSASPPHYDNMVNPRFTHIGVGVFIDSSGKLWTTHVFGG